MTDKCKAKGAKVTLLFYRARGNPRATILDKIVAWLDGGIFSHVEIVTRVDGYHVYTVGCHLFRGGVSRGYYDTRVDSCEFVTVEAVDNGAAFFEATLGKRYSICAAMRTKWHWLPRLGGWCCSSWVAAALGWAHAETLGVRDVYEMALLSEA